MLLKENKNYEKLMDDKNWIAEFKRDGNFLLVKYWKDNEGNPIIEFYNRKEEIYTKDIPKKVIDSFNKFANDEYAQSFTIVGELVYVDKDGRDHRTQAQDINAIPYFMAFDIMELNGENLRDRKWVERKHELTQLFMIYDMQPSKNENVIIVPHYADKRAVLKYAEELKMEGIVLKNINGLYVEGRSNDNIKVKFKETDEFIVIGYVNADEFTVKKTGESSPNKRFDYFGALILAKYNKNGNLQPKGRVGGGFTDEDLIKVTTKLNKEDTEGNTTHFIREGSSIPDNYPNLIDKDYRYAKNTINWLDINDWFIVEISMSGQTEYGNPFQPAFVSIRDDKKPEDCVQDE